jgi:hypothetical protein
VLAYVVRGGNKYDERPSGFAPLGHDAGHPQDGLGHALSFGPSIGSVF